MDIVALLANEARVFRLRLLFGACSLQNEVGDPPFVCLFGKSRSLPFCLASLRKSLYVGTVLRERPYLGSEQPGLVATLLGWPKSIY